MNNVTYCGKVESLVDDIKEQLLQEFMSSDDNMKDSEKVKELILIGRTLDMITQTALKLQAIEDKLDILLERTCKEDAAE